MSSSRSLPALPPDHARAAIVEPESGWSLSYRDLEETVERLAGELVALGVAPGAHVGLMSGNGPEVVLAFLAVARAGAAAVPINPSLTGTEIARMFEELAPALLLVDRAESSVAVQSVCRRFAVAAHEIARIPSPAFGTASATAAPPEPDPEAVALLLQTSGTTSRPKTVPLRHRHLVASARTIAGWYALGPEDVTYCVMPLFHIHGLVASTLATLASGGTLVVPRRVRPRAFLPDLAANGVTWVSAVPTLMARLAGAGPGPDAASLERLRFARTSSAALAPAMIAEFEAAFGVPILEAYGMTEATHQMASNPLPPGERRPGTVGLATGIEIATIDEAWDPVAPGVAGEVAIRGATVIDSYLDNPEANAASFRDGWFRTGDVGTLSRDGYLTLVGRIKELINRGGEKIAPREIDEVLLAHAGVAEAVAYGVPDAKYGEIVHAVVVARAPVQPAELIAHCAAHLAAFKVPVAVRVVDEIPKGPTGKVQRVALAEQLGA